MKRRQTRLAADGTIEVELTHGQWARIDAIDLARVSPYTWSAILNGMGTYYAFTRVNGRTIYMHRLVMEAVSNTDVDHCNHDTLDNRRCNLAVVTHAQNMLNRAGANRNSSTGVRGLYVKRVKSGVYYQARVQVKGRHVTKNFPFTDAGKEDAITWVEREREKAASVLYAPPVRLLRSGIPGVYTQRSRNGTPSYAAKIQRKGQWLTKYFPYTDEGKQSAAEWLQLVRSVEPPAE